MHSTENYTQYFVMTYKGKESGIYIYSNIYMTQIYIYIYIYIYLNHFTLETHTTSCINSTSIKKIRESKMLTWQQVTGKKITLP